MQVAKIIITDDPSSFRLIGRSGRDLTDELPVVSVKATCDLKQTEVTLRVLADVEIVESQETTSE